ncbi:MAG: SMP-30/gluconolactonase/LRE family protein [Alphaproteobacteria bacterium]|nr:SMP-30/gluconolactonase/LRE family protein [Alphaproteobacteria bacterium]
MAVDLIFPAANTVGESLVWDDRRQRLLWVDIVGKKIHSLAPESGDLETWRAPDFVTSIGLRDDGGAVVGLTKQLCLWDYDTEFRPLADIETDLPGNRLNEGVVGPEGAFWVGTMQNNIGPDGAPTAITDHTGRLYRCTARGEVFLLSEETFGITNTLVWDDRGGLITADTLKNEIYRFDIGSDGSKLENRKTIVSQFERGLPDGSCLDSEGFIWNCRVVGGSCLLRFTPSGELDRVIDLPCTWPTSCAFGGKNLDTLYVTSARFTMSEEHLNSHPQEGGLFAVDAGVTGAKCNRFGDRSSDGRQVSQRPDFD